MNRDGFAWDLVNMVGVLEKVKGTNHNHLGLIQSSESGG